MKEWRSLADRFLHAYKLRNLKSSIPLNMEHIRSSLYQKHMRVLVFCIY